MKVTILSSDKGHPITPYLLQWRKRYSEKYTIEIKSRVKDITSSGGDILFLVSCSEIVKEVTRKLFRYTLVLHASDLPEGRGWSPHIWDIINGKDVLTLSLLNAEDSVDTGDIWQKRKIVLDGSELYDEINHKLFLKELELMTWACENIDNATPHVQKNLTSSYHRKRTPQDSQMDVEASIASQFNLLRVCDPDRFPAYLMINNIRYNIRLEKADD